MRCTHRSPWRHSSGTPPRFLSSFTSPSRMTIHLCRHRRLTWRNFHRVGPTTGGCMQPWVHIGTRPLAPSCACSRSVACGSRRCWCSRRTTVALCTQAQFQVSTIAAEQTTGPFSGARARTLRAVFAWRPLRLGDSSLWRCAGQSWRPTSTSRIGTRPSATWQALITATTLPWRQGCRRWTPWTSGRSSRGRTAPLRGGRFPWLWRALGRMHPPCRPGCRVQLTLPSPR
mmetsp:Transcript_11985/g.32907  ORF Transcript_11985/g.32907 Transcript_11985/m.32907 type:complete len:229 (+) Transcript_11985:689-1375(+)